MNQMIDAVQAANLLSDSTEQYLAFGFSLLCGIGQQAYCIQMIRKRRQQRAVLLCKRPNVLERIARLIGQ